MNNKGQNAIKSVVLILALALGSVAFGADLTSGSRIFIEGMTPEMEGFIVAAVHEQKVPITITRNKEKADFVLLGAEQIAKRGWKRAVFGGEPDTGSARLYDSNEDLVWSSSAGGRSYFKGDSKSAKRIAKKLINDLNKTFFKGKK